MRIAFKALCCGLVVFMLVSILLYVSRKIKVIKLSASGDLVELDYGTYEFKEVFCVGFPEKIPILRPVGGVRYFYNVDVYNRYIIKYKTRFEEARVMSNLESFIFANGYQRSKEREFEYVEINTGSEIYIYVKKAEDGASDVTVSYVPKITRH